MPSQKELAMQLMEKKKFSEAIPFFLELIESKSDDKGLYYMLGQCYRFTNQIKLATENLSKAVSLQHLDSNEEPTIRVADQDIWFAFGVALQLEGNLNDSEKALLHTLDLILEDGEILAPGSSFNDLQASTLNSLGLTYRKMRNYKKALEYYDMAYSFLMDKAIEKITEEGKFVKILQDKNKKEVMHMEPGYLEEVKALLMSTPHFCTVNNNIGCIYMDVNDLESARKSFKDAIEFTPTGSNFPAPHLNLEKIS